MLNAEAAFDQGLFRHGFAIVDSLLRRAPNVALWKAKGTQLQILKLPVAAAHAYEEALAIKPDPIVEIALAVARSDAGDAAAAVAIYDKLVDHDDAEVSAVAHANRGNLHEAKDDVDSAKRDYEAAIEREPGRIAHYQNLSRLFTKRKKWREALEVVERGIAAMGEGDATPLLLEKARAENELEDPEAAMATADAILEKEPEHTRALYHRAWAQGLLGRLDEAKETLETLLDIDPTNTGTTASEAFKMKRGVCQDFANLFICLARLLSVPARYVCGYVYCGPRATSDAARANAVQSEASHAWVQLYLPEVGWKGFDPTNGVLTQTDHVRVAVGRSYVDATPTSGTIFVGGGGETLEVDVRCELVK